MGVRSRSCPAAATEMTGSYTRELVKRLVKVNAKNEAVTSVPQLETRDCRYQGCCNARGFSEQPLTLTFLAMKDPSFIRKVRLFTDLHFDISVGLPHVVLFSDMFSFPTQNFPGGRYFSNL